VRVDQQQGVVPGRARRRDREAIRARRLLDQLAGVRRRRARRVVAVERRELAEVDPLDVCIQPARSLKPWSMKNCPQVSAP